MIPARAEGGPRAALVVVEFTGKSHARVDSTVRLMALVGAAALSVAAAVSWLVAGRVLAPIRQVRRTADAISESDLTRRIPTPPEARDDDVAQLASTFNRMLDRIESAFASQREFLDDAAHELRTPLTVIRGHLELMGDDPTERAETSALMVDEIQRMDRIVDDLLVVAKAERPDFLSIEAVDLTDLVVTVVAKASPLADRAWAITESAEGSILADGQRLTQALMQLVTNAVRHTRPGDRITVGSRIDGGQAILTVADAGPGVPVPARESIFDRYHRGAGGKKDGAGLGLAIVRSIARAHGGHVSVGDSPEGGAAFVLTLPARLVPALDEPPARTPLPGPVHPSSGRGAGQEGAR